MWSVTNKKCNKLAIIHHAPIYPIVGVIFSSISYKKAVLTVSHPIMVIKP